MTKIITYEGNSLSVSRAFSTSTTLSAYTVTLTVAADMLGEEKLVTATGVVSGQGVVFTIPPMTLEKGIYQFEITAETATQKVTLEQDRMLINESLVYLT
jgi:hypothetical protein